MKVAKQTQPLLRHTSEFESILRSYKPSAESLATLRAVKLVLLAGPTAAGRNTLMNLLTQTGRYYYLASDTTRPPRTNNGILERNGIEYWFKSEEEFLGGLKNGEYIEAAVIHRQQVSGLHIQQLEDAKTKDVTLLKEIEINGADVYVSYKPDVMCVFLLPPSFEVWMQRIRGRGEMSEDELRRRLESARNEISFALKQNYYIFVINKEIHDAATFVDELANGAKSDQADQSEARAHAEQLAIDVQLYLNA